MYLSRNLNRFRDISSSLKSLKALTSVSGSICSFDKWSLPIISCISSNDWLIILILRLSINIVSRIIIFPLFFRSLCCWLFYQIMTRCFHCYFHYLETEVASLSSSLFARSSKVMPSCLMPSAKYIFCVDPLDSRPACVAVWSTVRRERRACIWSLHVCIYWTA